MPGDDRVQGEDPQERRGGLVLMVQDLAAAFEHAMPFFDAPGTAVPLEALAGLLGRGQGDRGQQQSLDRKEMPAIFTPETKRGRMMNPGEVRFQFYDCLRTSNLFWA